MKLHRYVDHQRLHIVTKDVISLSISVLLLFRHYISHKITFGAPSSGGVLCSACGAFILKLRCRRADKKLICAWNRVRLLLQYLQTFSICSIIHRVPQIRLLSLANKNSSPTCTLSLPNLSPSVVNTVICRQNSRLYGVSLASTTHSSPVVTIAFFRWKVMFNILIRHTPLICMLMI